MYPRNAASPERLAVGAVVQISDGAVQGSGVSIAVIPQGGASGAGGGTTAYDNGITLYTPTQAETNYASFIVIAYKTGCIPVSVTVVTSKSATTGYAGLDWGQVLNPTTTVGLTGTTIATTQKVDVETIKTQAVTASAGVTFPTSIASPTNITAGTITTVTNLTNAPTAGDFTATMKASLNAATPAVTVSDKTGFSLAGTQTFNNTGTWTGNIVGTLSTVTTLTNLPAITANWITAAGIAASALNGKGDWSTYAGTDTSGTTTLLSRLTATRAGYLDNLGAALAEAYRADGATGTLAELLYEVVAHLGESSIVGTTKTIKKINGSTTAATFTLDDATTPTSITRAT
jgi:hypothetical protein